MSPIEEWGDSSEDQNSTWMVSGADVNESNFVVSNWSLESSVSDWSPASRSSPLFHTACALLLASYLAPTYSRWQHFTEDWVV